MVSGLSWCIVADMNFTLSNMRTLLVCLLIVYLFQFYNGYTLLSLWLWTPNLDCNYFQV